ncbi:hypothetical protein [Enterovibrio paralichthyis]|uniref:hypothetical protein n=1 Tax=Enterovibrio paralichthyis TaxID=2853805 RepID=UPI001C485F99|nr:hypothetical protein [Enterovibrio paralichthyis]MBV7298353.1 hypothetical protein [Enterovibrio paralichthyis]
METQHVCGTSARVRTEVTMPDELALAIDRALALSNRAGIAWILVEGNRIVASHRCFAGETVLSPRQFCADNDNERRLYLSSPPHRFSYTAGQLQEIAYCWNISQICYPNVSSKLGDALGLEALEIPGVLIETYPMARANESLFFGPAAIQRLKRPWTTCFISMNSKGQGVAYRHFLSGFGAESTLRHSVIRNAVLAIQEEDESQKAEIQQHLKECCTITVRSDKELSALQSKLALGKQSTLVTLCDYTFFCQLAESNLIDECAVYVALTKLSPSQQSSAANDDIMPSAPTLEHWKVTATQAFEAGVLIQMRRKSDSLILS